MNKINFRTAIVAYNKNFVIGDSLGNIPWKISEDLKFFKKITMGHPCVMGSKTWDSIPVKYRPLQGRLNIVVSRNSNKFDEVKKFENAIASSSVELAIQMGCDADSKGEVFIIGGAQIYRYCIENNLIDRVIASEIKNYNDVKGAAFFSDLKELGWTGEILEAFEEFTVVEYRKNHVGN